ncbi:hypothetical protein KCP76_10755 [Salmonella enterica subsp. enterica serovar Weltevreden]|nr:hypothetical protein KCP76_10755 [Salmonella enterica subsp. enterica serovar Weltevreden]
MGICIAGGKREKSASARWDRGINLILKISLSISRPGKIAGRLSGSTRGALVDGEATTSLWKCRGL